MTVHAALVDRWTNAWQAGRVWRHPVLGGRTVLVALALLAWVLMLRPIELGGPVGYVLVRGDSMMPTYDSSDLVLIRPAAAYGIGDVVGYRVPAGEIGAGHLVIHRIVGGDPAAGYLMQGDNNSSVDPWRPRPADIAGRAWLAIPGVGLIFAFIRQPAAAASLASALVVAWLVHRRLVP